MNRRDFIKHSTIATMSLLFADKINVF
ncbi:MAG: twin-arginine translocation signal domain-containing protein, partial [Pyrinomonadaceae bacterium]